MQIELIEEMTNEMQKLTSFIRSNRVKKRFSLITMKLKNHDAILHGVGQQRESNLHTASAHIFCKLAKNQIPLAWKKLNAIERF